MLRRSEHAKPTHGHTTNSASTVTRGLETSRISTVLLNIAAGFYSPFLLLLLAPNQPAAASPHSERPLWPCLGLLMKTPLPLLSL